MDDRSFSDNEVRFMLLMCKRLSLSREMRDLCKRTAFRSLYRKVLIIHEKRQAARFERYTS